jgi:molecular chaperone GrpE
MENSRVDKEENLNNEGVNQDINDLPNEAEQNKSNKSPEEVEDSNSEQVLEVSQQQIIDELNRKVLSLAAEIENTRKRSEQQSSELKKYAIQGFAKEVIGVLENFYLIMDNAPNSEISKNETINKFFGGIEITHNDLVKVFEKNGIIRLYPIGEKFDHNFHQAVSQVESKEEPGTILQVIQSGYLLNDRLLKEAMVIIAK